MAIEYLGLSEINGPLVVLEGVRNAALMKLWSSRWTTVPEKAGPNCRNI